MENATQKNSTGLLHCDTHKSKQIKLYVKKHIKNSDLILLWYFTSSDIMQCHLIIPFFSWTMWVKLSVPHQHWITGIYISFKFMKIIIIHAFTVSYESFASFLNAAVNWHAFNSLMIIKSSRPKKGWTQFAKKKLVKKSVQVAIVHHSFSWSC